MKAIKIPRIEIISIGNELLIGHTLDTNSHWISQRLNRVGCRLERVTKIRDELPAISYAVRESIERHPKVLITLGGLGPTYDDMTLRGVARALKRPLELNPGALRMVEDKYSRIEDKVKLTPYRRKMATIPRGALPIPNPVGTAPAVLSYTSGVAIICLPGVPSEMKAIFTKFLVPFLKSMGGGPGVEMQLRISGIIESALAPVLDRTRKIFRGLYFKSHPRGIETGGRSVIVLHIYNVNSSSPRSTVVRAVSYILQHISAL